MLFNRKISLYSSLSLEDLKSVLEANMQEKIPFNFVKKDHKPYAGHLWDDYFKARRIIHYRNSFLPQINGKFVEQGDYREIKIKMTLHPFSIVFLILFVFFILTGFLVLLIQDLNAGEFELLSFWPFLIILPSLLIILPVFNWEVRKSVKDFKAFFKAEEIDEAYS